MLHGWELERVDTIHLERDCRRGIEAIRKRQFGDPGVREKALDRADRRLAGRSGALRHEVDEGGMLLCDPFRFRCWPWNAQRVFGVVHEKFRADSYRSFEL